MVLWRAGKVSSPNTAETMARALSLNFSKHFLAEKGPNMTIVQGCVSSIVCEKLAWNSLVCVNKDSAT